MSVFICQSIARRSWISSVFSSKQAAFAWWERLPAGMHRSQDLFEQEGLTFPFFIIEHIIEDPQLGMVNGFELLPDLKQSDLSGLCTVFAIPGEWEGHPHNRGGDFMGILAHFHYEGDYAPVETWAKQYAGNP